MDDGGEDRHVVGAARDRVPVEAEHLAGRVDRMRDEPAGDHLERVQAVEERRCDAEVAAAAAERPHQVGLAVVVDVQGLAIGGHELDADQVVAAEAVLRHQPAEPASERVAGDARGRDRAAGHGEPVSVRVPVELLPCHAALRTQRACLRIDVDSLHRREVDHQPAVRHGSARDVVSASPDRDLEAARAREVDRLCDVGRSLATGDECRPAVDESVVDEARLVVAVVSRKQDGAGKARAERLEQRAVDRRGGHADLPVRSFRSLGPVWHRRWSRHNERLVAFRLHAAGAINRA